MDHALAAAIRRADRDELADLAAAAVRREAVEPLTALLAVVHRFDASPVQLDLTQPVVARACRKIAGGSDAHARQNVIQAVIRQGPAEHLDLLVELAEGSDDAGRHAAAMLRDASVQVAVLREKTQLAGRPGADATAVDEDDADGDAGAPTAATVAAVRRAVGEAVFRHTAWRHDAAIDAVLADLPAHARRITAFNAVEHRAGTPAAKPGTNPRTKDWNPSPGGRPAPRHAIDAIRHALAHPFNPTASTGTASTGTDTDTDTGPPNLRLAALLPALAIGRLADAAMQGLRLAIDHDRWADLFTHAHWLSHPHVRATIARHVADSPAGTRWWPQPPSTNVPDCPDVTDCVAHHLVAWGRLVTPRPEARIDRLVALLGHRVPAARLAALHALLDTAREHRHPSARSPRSKSDAAENSGPLTLRDRCLDAIESAVFDDDEHVAHAACRALAAGGGDRFGRLLTRLCNSPHDRIRQRVRAGLGERGFASLWQRWPKLAQTERLRLGHTLIQLDPAFHSRLLRRLVAPGPRHALASSTRASKAGGKRGDKPDAATRPDATHLAAMSQSQRARQVRALHIIATLGQGAFFESLLVGLTRSPHPRLAASAALALGTTDVEAEGGPALAALQRCLEHGDDRVRANALEALARLEARTPATAPIPRTLWSPWAKPGHTPRIRANAVHAWLDHCVTTAPNHADHPISGHDPLAPAAMRALHELLEDRRAEHRRSGLWVVEQTGVLEATTRVAEMSVSDPDHQLRERAHRLTHRLITAIHGDAPEPTGPDPANSGPVTDHDRVQGLAA